MQEALIAVGWFLPPVFIVVLFVIALARRNKK